MSDDILGDRRKALEEQFFHDQDRELVERLRQQREGEQRREALAAVSGIHDSDALDALVAADIEPDTLAALGLVPLVATAWADGKIDLRESEAVMRAAAGAGVESGSPAYELLEGWLRQRPAPALVEAWSQYVSALPDDVRARLRDDVMGRARAVAEAAGGFLGVIAKVSADEERVLAELERAFG